jgi:7-keto-8-aminopelargonate synthetase-like enzyme
MLKNKKYHFPRKRTLQTVERCLEELLDDDLLWRTLDAPSDRELPFNDRLCYNFGSCSYMGLHLHPEIIEGASDALRRYGTQLSFSRVYMACDLYSELEELLEKITGRYALVGASTTLSHLSALPVLVEDDDAVIIDQFAHASLHMALEHLGSTPIFRMRHSAMDKLESIIQELAVGHGKIWYVLDGLYSMRGDFAPFDTLNALLERYPQLHLYVDDAHSTSWYGKNGCGAAISHLPNHERVVVAISLNKAFSAAGGAVLVSSPEMKRKIRLCGGPMTFSGPIQAPMLGAAVASAKLHLKPEYAGMQEELMRKIEFTHQLAAKLGVKIISDDKTPIFMLPCESNEEVRLSVRSFWDDGFYVCPVVFPALPINSPGMRFTITSTNEFADIEKLMLKAQQLQTQS